MTAAPKKAAPTPVPEGERETVAEVLHRDIESVKTLNELTAQLNDRIKQFETLLRDQRLGVVARVETQPGKRWLSFRKFESRWTLCAETAQDGNEPDFKPLLEASRATRLYAVKYFRALFEAFGPALDAELKSLDRATQLADEVIDAITEHLVQSSPPPKPTPKERP